MNRSKIVISLALVVTLLLTVGHGQSAAAQELKMGGRATGVAWSGLRIDLKSADSSGCSEGRRSGDYCIITGAAPTMSPYCPTSQTVISNGSECYTLLAPTSHPMSCPGSYNESGSLCTYTSNTDPGQCALGGSLRQITQGSMTMFLCELPRQSGQSCPAQSTPVVTASGRFECRRAVALASRLVCETGFSLSGSECIRAVLAQRSTATPTPIPTPTLTVPAAPPVATPVLAVSTAVPVAPTPTAVPVAPTPTAVPVAPTPTPVEQEVRYAEPLDYPGPFTFVEGMFGERDIPAALVVPSGELPDPVPVSNVVSGASTVGSPRQQDQREFNLVQGTGGGDVTLAYSGSQASGFTTAALVLISLGGLSVVAARRKQDLQ